MVMMTDERKKLLRDRVLRCTLADPGGEIDKLCTAYLILNVLVIVVLGRPHMA